MARIPEAELERLKQEVSLVRLVEARGVELTPHGHDLIGLCPLHEDHEPSLVVSPGRNLWHCLGACQAGGSVIDWVMKAEQVSFRQAVEILRSEAPCPPPATTPASCEEVMPRSSAPPRLCSLIEASAEVQQALGQVIDYYHATLKESPEALAYLERRGLASREMIDHFKLGFSNRTLGNHLPQRHGETGARIRAALQEIGIVRSSGHEHFAGSLVIPVFDEDGRVTEIYGRKIGSNLRKGTPDHLYLPGPHRGVFNLQGVALSEEVILCEALLDALTFWCAGFRNVTSSYGVEGFTPDHLAAFKHKRVRRVLIAYDRDSAGDRAADKLAAELGREGFECFRVLFPRGMDANEYALKLQPVARSLALVLKDALWLGQGTAPRRSVLLKSARAEDPEQPRRATKEESSEAEEDLAVTEETAQGRLRLDAETGLSSLAAEGACPQPDRLEVSGADLVIRCADRRWRVRGLSKNASVDQLRVNLLVAREAQAGVLRTEAGASGYFVDTLDLYSARQRLAYLKQAAEELAIAEEVIKRELGELILALEEHRAQPGMTASAAAPATKPPQLSEEEREAALALLRDPRLTDRILDDFERCGVVGERTGKLVGYLAAISRKLDEPLAVVIQSSSAAGKTSLMEAILAFVPEEERVKYSAMTGQSLFYMGETDLAHKVLAVVEEEGAERASYALKLLQSERELSIASTGKDPQTGKLLTHEYRVEGPVAIFLTTTAAQVDEELLNRCIVLGVDEDRAQTRAIHELQRNRQTLEGLLARRDAEAVRKLHQNAQRLLRPLLVANPFARELTFLDDRTRTRRDHMKYLTLIRAIALLHQVQREVRSVVHEGQVVSYIEVTAEDIALANRLAHQVLGRSLDELAPQTRRLLLCIEDMVREACAEQGLMRCEHRFTRREIRERTGWGSTQLKVHMQRLEELEYAIVHRGGRGQQLVYELLYGGEGKDGSPFLPGLTDPSSLERAHYDGNRSGVEGHRSGLIEEKSGTGRGQVGPKSGPCRGGRDRGSLSDDEVLSTASRDPARNAPREVDSRTVRVVVPPRRTDLPPASTINAASAIAAPAPALEGCR